MTIQFVTAEVALLDAPEALHRAILATLELYGEPLRWAITAVNQPQQTLSIEAIVLQPNA